MGKKAKKTTQEQQDKAITLKLSRAQVTWFVAIALMAFIWFIFPGYGRHGYYFFDWLNSSSAQTTEYEDDYVDGQTYGLENIELVSNWTLEDYEAIDIATVTYDSDYEIEDYYGGGSFEELEEKVGRPSATYRDDSGDFETITATWDYDSDTDYISIDVIYLADNDMIIDKHIYGSTYDW